MNNMDDYIFCSICYEIAIIARHSSCCGQLFCNNCAYKLRSVKICSMCRQHCAFYADNPIISQICKDFQENEVKILSKIEDFDEYIELLYECKYNTNNKIIERHRFEKYFTEFIFCEKTLIKLSKIVVDNDYGNHIDVNMHLQIGFSKLINQNILNLINEKEKYINILQLLIKYLGNNKTINRLSNVYINDLEKSDTFFIGTLGYYSNNMGDINYKKIKKPNEIKELIEINGFNKKSINEDNHPIKTQVSFLYGTVELEIQFDDVIKELICSPVQMLILLLFNDNLILSTLDIVKSIGISHNIILPQLISMCHPLNRILHKKPNIKITLPTDKFQMVKKAPSFTKIKLMKYPEKFYENFYACSPGEKLNIESKICCIIASRRHIRYHLLLAELSHIYFGKNYTIQLYKKCITNLEKQNYIKIDNNIILYVA